MKQRHEYLLCDRSVLNCDGFLVGFPRFNVSTLYCECFIATSAHSDSAHDQATSAQEPDSELVVASEKWRRQEQVDEASVKKPPTSLGLIMLIFHAFSTGIR